MMAQEKKVVLITGGGRGIGAATAELLARKGVRVYVASRSRAELDAVAKKINSAGGQCLPLVCDVADETAVVQLFSKIRDESGGVDILVNNAALIHQALFSDQLAADWDRLMNVNVRGVFLCAQQAFRQMAEKKAGTIVNVASLGAIHGTEKFPGFSAYTTSKYAVVGMTEAMAVEARPLGIRVVGIAPGAVRTRMLEQAAPGLRTTTTPEHIADIICYLALAEPAVPLNGTVLEIHSNA